MTEFASDQIPIGHREESHDDAAPRLSRRRWIQLASAAAAGIGQSTGAWGFASRPDEPDGKPAAPDAEGAEADDLKRAEARARRVTQQPLSTLQSTHYQVVGDASNAFLKLTLSDCERMAADYLEHFRGKGFDVTLPKSRMTVIAFRDERPFSRFAEKTPPGTMGFYSRTTNWLALFDFRNVPMFPHAPGPTNMETLTHESTHQLSFNTGLLVRESDIPRSIVEGIAMYCERRRLFDRTRPGEPNLRRLDELAHLQRRVTWVPVADLLGEDRVWFRHGGDGMLLCYAESWLLVYHLLTTAARLPQLRAYLDTIRGRRDDSHRLADAQTHFGDLDLLDREIRQEGIRLQRGR